MGFLISQNEGCFLCKAGAADCQWPFVANIQGWRQEFSDGGLTPPTKDFKYGFQGTTNAKNLGKNHFLPFDRGLACSERGL